MMKGEQESNDVQELPKTPDYNDTKRAGFITHSALHNILLKTLYSSLGSQLKTFMFCHSLAQIKKALFFLERRETQSEPLDQSRPDFRSHGVFLMRSSHLFRLDVGDFKGQCFLWPDVTSTQCNKYVLCVWEWSEALCSCKRVFRFTLSKRSVCFCSVAVSAWH